MRGEDVKNFQSAINFEMKMLLSDFPYEMPRLALSKGAKTAFIICEHSSLKFSNPEDYFMFMYKSGWIVNANYQKTIRGFYYRCNEFYSKLVS